MRAWRTAVAATALALLAFGGARAEDDLRATFDEARRLIDAGQAGEAAWLLEGRLAVAQPDERLALHGSLGDTYLMLAESGQALAHYDALLALRPDHRRGTYKRGEALEMMRRLRDAIAAYERAIELGHARGEALARIGFCYRLLSVDESDPAAKRDLVKRSTDALRQAITADPSNRSAMGNLADMAVNVGRADLALPLYLEMDRVEPGVPTTLERIGSTYMHLGQPANALPFLRSAIEILESHRPPSRGDRWVYRDATADAHLKAGEALVTLGRREEARPHLETVLLLADCPTCMTTSALLQRALPRAQSLLDSIRPVPASPEP